MEQKVGNPTTEELLLLAHDIGTKWKNLGRVLGIPDTDIEVIDEEQRKLIDKSYKMLLTWKQGRGTEATYLELNAGLRHAIVLRVDLAEKYCFATAAVIPRGPVTEEDVPM